MFFQFWHDPVKQHLESTPSTEQKHNGTYLKPYSICVLLCNNVFGKFASIEKKLKVFMIKKKKLFLIYYLYTSIYYTDETNKVLGFFYL